VILTNEPFQPVRLYWATSSVAEVQAGSVVRGAWSRTRRRAAGQGRPVVAVKFFTSLMGPACQHIRYRIVNRLSGVEEAASRMPGLMKTLDQYVTVIGREE
jgi:hypothetical protein